MLIVLSKIKAIVNVQKRNNCIVTILALQNGFIDRLRIITTSNYNTIANFHTLQISTTRTKYFQSAVFSPVVPW
jgi:hypothetical protein